ncbi:Ig-like domain-containing protein [Yimella sp. cx-51]|uniref:Ig-like domain-containing protein n=1 Tax=Yimella sp. cx-51 TaxID=2770551 RepID=UPI00165D44F8|nr:Ig-like domain-containing protein [Yimella sp. cx-51]MBC9955935.1 tandem-95 repeat protein [Yimella sp. cx-51]QTH37525.1 tandem-95 repeat protein [Yimella sp. cx-51]
MSSRGLRNAAVLCVMSLVVGLLAAFHQGVPTKDLKLNDGGVWVVNQALRLAAHLNYPSRTLDGGVQSTAATFDVDQSGNTIALRDTAAGGIQGINPATLVLASALRVPLGMSTSQGGDTLAIADPKAGKVWALDARTATEFSATSTPVVSGLPGARLVTGVDGAVNAVGTGGVLRRIARQGASWTAQDAGTMPGVTDVSKLVLTAVGDQMVALDTVRGEVHSAKGTVALGKAADAVLQQPGEAAAQVRLATATELISVPLDAGSPTRVAAGSVTAAGVPAAPVVVAGCTYAAWSGTGNYRRDCGDEAKSEARTVSALAGGGQLVYRVNRAVVVLNDIGNGDVYLVDKNMQKVNNWQDIRAQLEDQKKRDSKQSTTETTAQRSDADKDTNNRKPIALDDAYGVRAGTSVTLPALDNDSDPDGDVLVAKPTTSTPVGKVSAVRGGQALQIETNASATGAGTFRYAVSDGRGGTAEASVKVTVFPTSVQNPPISKRTSTLEIVQGGRVAYNVLQDWIDPEGDPIFLKSAASTKGATVTYNEQGSVTIVIDGTAAGTLNVPVVVSDGTKDASGSITVKVKSRGNVLPVANTDFVLAPAGVDVVVKPLLNDTDANGDSLRLVQAGPVPASGQGSLRVDNSSGTLTLNVAKAGTYYLPYTVSDGTGNSTGRIRVDVAAPGAKAQPPVAENDLAALPVGGSVLVPVLDNDVDPAGGVLVLQLLQLPTASSLQVEMVGREMVRVTAPGGLTGRQSFSYTVSNGQASATAAVAVVPVPPPATVSGPEARPDAATVRAGDIVTLDVLANDRSPGGLTLTLDQKLETVGSKPLGTAFVSAGKVRFLAGATPGDVHLTYTVRDSRANLASADVHITVRAADKQNAAPTPSPLTLRLLAGTTAKVAVPLDGIDPDGDSVTLLGVDRPAGKGTVTVVDGQLQYAALPSATGSDTFTYAVADRFGAKGTATVTVGIAPDSGQNQSPVAVADNVIARTGRQLSIPVLTNDFDPDGDKITVVAGSVKPVDGRTTAQATAVGPRVDLITPETVGVQRFYYEITDGRGGTGRGVLAVDVRKDAPLLAPVARDDIIAASTVANKKSVTVDVLANDEDPDGSSAALTLKTGAAGVQVTADRKLIVPVTDQRQLMLYEVTDPDGQVGRAVIVVPPATGLPPTLRLDRVPLTATAGAPLSISIPNYLTVRSGRSVQLQNASGVKTPAGAAVQVKDPRNLVFTADKTFAGPSSVTFPVTDGTTPNDPAGLTAVITIPITVKPAPNPPKAEASTPVIRPTAVQVAIGEAAVSVDVAAMVTDRDPGAMAGMQYRIGGAPAGFTASLNGRTLRVGASGNARVGQTGSIALTATSPSGKSATAPIPVTVVGSTRPPMTVLPADLTVKAGQSATVDITSYVTNPYADSGKPLTLVGAPVRASGQGSVTASGTRVTVSPAADATGQMSVTYRVADASGQVDRQVQGVIRVTVLGKPSTPTGVTARSQASKTATVSWTDGDNNGSPLTGHVVKWPGGQQNCGAGSSCTINGLPNGRPLTFSVMARNAVGDSGWSGSSAAVTPDAKPSAPASLTATAGKTSVALSWPAAVVDGTKVTKHTVTSSNGASRDNGTSTSLNWTGLPGGTGEICFSVTATNAAGTSEPGPRSCATPFDQPGAFAVNTPAVTEAPDHTSNSVSVSWSPANANGSPVTYSVAWSGGTTQCQNQAATTCSFNVTATGTISVKVTAKNAGGESVAQVSGVNVARRVGSPTSVTARATGTDGQIAVTASGAAGNGNTVTYQARNGAGAWVNLPGGSGNVGGFTNGQAVQVSVRAVGDRSGPGNEVSAPAATPYGRPTAPQPSCSASGAQDIACSWSGGSGNGRPATYALTRDASGGVSDSGSYTFSSVGYSTTRTLCVRVTQAESGATDEKCASATSAAEPPPPVYRGDYQTRSVDCGGRTCTQVRLFGYAPNSRVRCAAGSSGPGYRAWEWVGNVDGNGNHDWISNANVGSTSLFYGAISDPAHDFCSPN